jgi:sulfite reductase alpha subunit-like flavoprotein
MLSPASCRISYVAGDHVVVYPHNSPTLVNAMCERLGYRPEAVASLEPLAEYAVCATVESPRSRVSFRSRPQSSFRPPFRNEITVRHMLTARLDVAAVPSMRALRMLAAYAGPDDGAALKALSEKDAYRRVVDAGRVQLLDLLQVLPCSESNHLTSTPLTNRTTWLRTTVPSRRFLCTTSST